MSANYHDIKTARKTDQPQAGIEQPHWDRVYVSQDVDKLGWYEPVPEPSLRLIRSCALEKTSVILNVGAGTTTLVDELLRLGYQQIIANDISPVALGKLKQRLGKQQDKVKWVVDDLLHPSELSGIGPVDLWHDRAVLHFFTKPAEQEQYFGLLKKLVTSPGFVILATFRAGGATTCSGLPVLGYDAPGLEMKLGSDFEMVEAFDHRYTMPSGDSRKYIYALFKRVRRTDVLIPLYLN
jgi:EEF1A lysine methyltransferase 2